MSKQDELGERMKRYEASSKQLLPRRTFTLIRVDGKAFHTYTKDLDRPFDDGLIEAMNVTAQEMCRQIQGVVMAYVQSDEISVLLWDGQSPETNAWYDGNVQKMASVSASIATAAFNKHRLVQKSLAHDNAFGITDRFTMAHFDSRCFIIPDPVEVSNYFRWRQKDSMRNSVASVAQSLFSPKQLHGKNSGQMKEMIRETGQQTWEEYPGGCQRGRVILKANRVAQVTYTRKDTGKTETKEVMRTFWDVSVPPVFTSQPDFLNGIISSLSGGKHE